MALSRHFVSIFLAITAVSVPPDAVEFTYRAISRAEQRLLLEAARCQLRDDPVEVAFECGHFIRLKQAVGDVIAILLELRRDVGHGLSPIDPPRGMSRARRR